MSNSDRIAVVPILAFHDTTATVGARTSVKMAEVVRRFRRLVRRPRFAH